MKFKLKEIEIEVFLGVPDEERANKQKVLVTLDFEFDTKKAALSDNIKDTVDYFEIQQHIKNFAGNREFKLLEKLHQELLGSIQDKFKGLENITLKIEKFPFDDDGGWVVVS